LVAKSTPKKSAASRRKPRRKASTKKPSQRENRYLFKVLIVLFVLVVFGLVYLDARVVTQFEAKRWAAPANVYARPLEIYVGSSLSTDELEYELGLLGYLSSAPVARAGQYLRTDTGISVYLRSFSLPHQKVLADLYQINFDEHGITSVLDNFSNPVSLLTIDPLRIGGIYASHKEDRQLVRIDQLPEILLATVKAVEDQDFDNHRGISLRAIFRAAWANIRAGGVVQGGSTITQQLVKNFYLSSRRTLGRKIIEIPMSLLVELHFDKSEILEAYLNEVFLGQDGARAIHGFGLASQFYFGRSIGELQLHQMALLVGLVKGPSYYAPRRQPQRALARRNLVLDQLASANVVSQKQVTAAKQKPLDLSFFGKESAIKFPAFMDLVRHQLRRDYSDKDLTSEGLNIFTTLDPIIQRHAEQSLAEQISTLSATDTKLKNLEGALVVTSATSAEVLAFVGGKNARYSGFNRALNSSRPVGSLLKPAVYLTALAQPEKYTLATKIKDEAIRVPQPTGPAWQPLNYDRKSHGEVTLLEALTMSYNQASARLGMDVGVEAILQTLKSLGIGRELPNYPSIILGAGGFSPLEMTEVYQTIAAQGYDAPLRSIREATTSEGQLLKQYAFEIEQKFAPTPIHILTYALQEAMRNGTGKTVYMHLSKDINIAGKTGTSDDLRDSWFAGFTGDRLAVVWLGADDNTSIGLSGAGGAMQVWANLMKRLKPKTLRGVVPETVEYKWIQKSTGLTTAERCEGAILMPFAKGSAPEEHAKCSRQSNPVQSWLKSWFGN